MLSMLPAFPTVLADNSWYRTRPVSTVTFDQRVESAETDGKASVGLGVQIGTYVENDPGLGGKDSLSLKVSATANTRTGITYDVDKTGDGFWYGAPNPTGITGDDAGKWLDLPFTVRFYGGPGSCEYDRVWVCSNGFLSFDSDSTSYTPTSVPNAAKPNALVAAFWRNLNPSVGGSITYESSADYFAVSWNNVPNYGNGVPQTFQVVIYPIPVWKQNNIYFFYKDVTLDYTTTVGVEDQVGNKGTSYNYASLYSGAGLLFSSKTPSRRVSHLTIKLTKSDSYAAIDLLETEIGGFNVKLQDTSDPFGELFMIALGGSASLLLVAAPPMAGVIFTTTLIGMDLAGWYSSHFSPVLPVGSADASTDQNEAYVKAEGYCEKYGGGDSMDSALATSTLWIFYDPNNKDHGLTISAELEYWDEAVGYQTISTSTSAKLSVTPPVGGIQFPVNKFELLAPYIVVSVALVASVVSVALFKRRKKEG